MMDGQSHGNFYYKLSDVAFGPGRLFHCHTFPGDFLQIVYIQNMLIYLPLKVEKVTKSEKKYILKSLLTILSRTVRLLMVLACLMRGTWTESY